MPGRIHLAKHVVAVRSARKKHWVATVAGSSVYRSDRMIDMLHDSVQASDFTDRVRMIVNWDVRERNAQDEGAL